jgi:hypothetical protein
MYEKQRLEWPNANVLHPAALERIDTRNHFFDRPRPMTSKDLLEGLQQRGPLLEARRPYASLIAGPRL